MFPGTETKVLFYACTYVRIMFETLCLKCSIQIFKEIPRSYLEDTAETERVSRLLGLNGAAETREDPAARQNWDVGPWGRAMDSLTGTPSWVLHPRMQKQQARVLLG